MNAVELDNSAKLKGEVKTFPAPADGVQNFKVKLPLKLLIFSLSVITLSWFFEGHRRFQAALTPDAIAILLLGTILTLALIVLQAFFIYAEEKSKGNRTRKIKLFDTWYAKLSERSQSRNSTSRGRQD